MEVVAISAAAAAGLSWQRLAILGSIIAFPLAAAAAIAIVIMKFRTRPEGVAPSFCDAVAAEVRAGASLLHAVGAAGASVGKPALAAAADSGSAAEVARTLRREFPAIGDELAATVGAVSASGPEVADLFDEIGSFALAIAEVRSEVRVATAPARTTALVLVGAPVAFIAYRVSATGADGLVMSGSQALVGVIGLGLFLTGLALAAVLAWMSV